MSAPEPDLDEQVERHKPALAGMTLAVVFAFTLLVGLLGWVFYQADGPEGADIRLDALGRPVDEG